MNGRPATLQEFPSQVHHRIYLERAFLVPLEVSLQNEEDLPADLAEGCRQYYEFLQRLLSGLYDDPLRFGLPAGAFEAFLNGSKPHAKKRQDPKGYDKLRSVTYSAGTTYQRFLYRFCREAALRGDQLFLEGKAWEKLMHEFRGDRKQRPDDFLTGVPYPLRLARLREYGLELESGEASGVLCCPGRPLMLRAMKALADAGQRVKPFDWYGIHYCEFRHLLSPCKPTFEDVVRHLDGERQRPLRAIHQYLLDHKARPSCTTFHKVDYKYRGVQAVQIGIDEFSVRSLKNQIYVRVNGAYWWWPDGEKLVNGQLLRRDAELQEYAQRHVNYCTGCSTSHDHGGYATILGRRKCLCGGIDFKAFTPGMEEVSQLEKLIDIRLELTDCIKAEEKERLRKRGRLPYEKDR